MGGRGGWQRDKRGVLATGSPGGRAPQAYAEEASEDTEQAQRGKGPFGAGRAISWPLPLVLKSPFIKQGSLAGCQPPAFQTWESQTQWAWGCGTQKGSDSSAHLPPQTLETAVCSAVSSLLDETFSCAQPQPTSTATRCPFCMGDSPEFMFI